MSPFLSGGLQLTMTIAALNYHLLRELVPLFVSTHEDALCQIRHRSIKVSVD